VPISTSAARPSASQAGSKGRGFFFGGIMAGEEAPASGLGKGGGEPGCPARASVTTRQPRAG
jgi:hypothetical protein